MFKLVEVFFVLCGYYTDSFTNVRGFVELLNAVILCCSRSKSDQYVASYWQLKIKKVGNFKYFSFRQNRMYMAGIWHAYVYSVPDVQKSFFREMLRIFVKKVVVNV